MKNMVLSILSGSLGAAEDDLYRAESAFKGMCEEELSLQHGQGNCTRGEILRRYTKRRDEVRDCIDWVNEK